MLFSQSLLYIWFCTTPSSVRSRAFQLLNHTSSCDFHNSYSYYYFYCFCHYKSFILLFRCECKQFGYRQQLHSGLRNVESERWRHGLLDDYACCCCVRCSSSLLALFNCVYLKVSIESFFFLCKQFFTMLCAPNIKSCFSSVSLKLPNRYVSTLDHKW